MERFEFIEKSFIYLLIYLSIIFSFITLNCIRGKYDNHLGYSNYNVTLKSINVNVNSYNMIVNVNDYGERKVSMNEKDFYKYLTKSQVSKTFIMKIKNSIVLYNEEITVKALLLVGSITLCIIINLIISIKLLIFKIFKT